MTKGDKIKLIKPLGILDNIGEVYTVTRVTDSGFVFKSETVCGYLTLDEFSEYFTLVNKKKEEHSERKWTKWNPCGYIELPENDIWFASKWPVVMRSNGHRVCVKAKTPYGGTITAHASCSPLDKFDVKKGEQLAKARLYPKAYKLLTEQLRCKL